MRFVEPLTPFQGSQAKTQNHHNFCKLALVINCQSTIWKGAPRSGRPADWSASCQFLYTSGAEYKELIRQTLFENVSQGF